MGTGARIPYPDGEVVTTYYNSMGLPAKLTSSQLGDLIDGTVNVSAVTNAVNYDEAGRLVDMRMPYGTDLWRRQGYYGWTSSSSPYYGGGNGRLYYIFVGTTQGSLNRLNLNYSYDSFGNVKQHYDNSGYFSFGYDGQNRLTSAYSQSYGYDISGRLTSYEGNSYSAYDGHAILKSGYSYDANGNLISRAGRTLAWNHENRLQSVSGGGLSTESYLYDDSGIRVKKTTGSTNSYYPFAHYEISGSTTIKYYFFGGQRVAMMNGSTFSYLHADHLGSTVLETNTSGNLSADQKYRAYGNQRDSGPVVTDHKFTGQKLDGTGLMYYQSRYYDPALGAFISPDTIVPDAGNLFDYNRYMYVRGRVLNMNDPSGHYAVKDDPDDVRYILNPKEGLGQAVGVEVWDEIAKFEPQPLYDAIGVFVPSSIVSPSKNSVNAGITGGFEVIWNKHTGVVTAFSIIGLGAEGTAGVVAKSAQVTFIQGIGEDNLAYSGNFVARDITVAYGGRGVTLGYAYTPRQEFGGSFSDFIARNTEASYSYTVGPAAGSGGNLSASYVNYLPLASYENGVLTTHNGAISQEQADYLGQVIQQGIGILDRRD